MRYPECYEPLIEEILYFINKHIFRNENMRVEKTIIKKEAKKKIKKQVKKKQTKKNQISD